MADAGDTATTMPAAGGLIARAIKASGAVVHLEPRDFAAILSRAEKPLLIVARTSKEHQYLTWYRGFTFFTRSSDPMVIPGHAERIEAKKIDL